MRRFVVLASVLIGCDQAAPDAAPAPVAGDSALLSAATVEIAGFEVAAVARSPWQAAVTASARVALNPATTEPIGSIVEGRITKVYAMPGDRVNKGDVLVAIHSHEMMDARASQRKAVADLARATGLLTLATSSAARAERLFGLKALSQADADRARADLTSATSTHEAASAEVERSEALIEHLVGHDAKPSDYDEHWVLIRAPLNGQVVARQAEPGNVVLVGAPLVTVSRTTDLILVIQVPEASASGIRNGGGVRFTVPALGSDVFSARISRVFPAVDSVRRTVEVHATVQGPTRGLKAEMFATANVLGVATAPTLSVPSAAIQSFEGDTVVIATDPRGSDLMISAVRVKVGRSTSERTELLGGLDSGRTVIVRGAAIAKAEILKRRAGGSDEH